MIGCQKCGECCKWMGVPPNYFNFDMDYLKARGGKMIDGIALFPARCPQLKEDNTCAINDRKPEYCKWFPSLGLRNFMPQIGCKFFGP